MLKPLFIFLFGVFSLTAFAQNIWMHPNEGQWDDRVEYKVDINVGEFFIEKDGFTYFLHNGNELIGHKHDEAHEEESEKVFNAHVIKSKFIGSSWKGEVLEEVKSSFYRNYILGNDPSKWKGELYSYGSLKLLDYYQGIDLELSGLGSGLKYSLRVQPGIDPSQIRMNYEGQDSLSLDEEGNLLIHSRFGEVIEEAPVAWVEDDNGNRRSVEVAFKIEGNEVLFDLPDGYTSGKTLVIDPNITFSTFTGSTADNWGMSATPDDSGNAFGGGIVFGAGYPVTSGAYDNSYNAGSGGTNVDVGITKFTADGTSLIYSTYLGGTGSETPNSLVCSPTGELYIFGVTASADFPMGPSPFDNTFGGGPNMGANANGTGFSQGSDLYVARLNAAGTGLIASTYVGGVGTDGFNVGALNYNYGDQFRGEIILDAFGDVYVSSTTQSVDFPVLNGPGPSLQGVQDAVAFKMPSTLNTMIWSGYYGGSGLESGNSIQVAGNGNVYMAGGTTSSSLGTALGYDLSFGGGLSDGYVVRLNGATGAVLSGTYIGVNEYDQSYFVQLDLDDNVYVLGQTESDLGITAGLYGNQNSGQFIHKYNNTLTVQEWKTMIGASSGHVEISPTAFLVSDCYDIYLSGWGGNLNQNGPATFSSTTGFPVTANAFQGTTTGSNFYIAVLSMNAATFKYGTFMGGFVTSSPDHVDGGTSRFDKDGYIYHAVCGSCGNGVNNGFTTTPGVWAPFSQSNNCNMAVFKFELSVLEALVNTPSTTICWPDPVVFNNNSANGNDFFWDFGDGTTSNQVNPTHNYPGPGIYNVMLIVSDTNNCYVSDTTYIAIEILDFQGSISPPPGPICPGDSFQFNASGGTDYLWSPAQYLDNPTISNPTATVNQTTTFTVIIGDSCGIDTITVTLPVFNDNMSVIDDTAVCIGSSVQLFATGGASYNWSPPTFLDNPTIATPVCTPTSTTQYIVDVVSANGCELIDTVTVEVFFNPPIPVIPDVVNLCEGESVDIVVSGATSYNWYPNVNITPTSGSVVTVNPSSDMYYYCNFINACGSVLDSVYVDIVEASIIASPDTIICPGQSVYLIATGGVAYHWEPSGSLNNANNSAVIATPNQPTYYIVTGIDQYGCVNYDTVFVDLYPQAFIQTSPDVYAFYGDIIPLAATSTTDGIYIWAPPEFISCVTCVSPLVNPDQDYTYYVSYTDSNGCSATDSVHIYYDPIIYVPNTFTPNDDEFNVTFFAVGGNIKSFEMVIFDRWGELIFESHDINEGWDGTYLGRKCQDGTYIWKIKISDFDDEEQEMVGHVNLLR